MDFTKEIHRSTEYKFSKNVNNNISSILIKKSHLYYCYEIRLDKNKIMTSLLLLAKVVSHNNM